MKQKRGILVESGSTNKRKNFIGIIFSQEYW